jgi:hypothetical protein
MTRPRKVVARLECSLQPDAGETTSTGIRQEVDIRYVVTSFKGSAQYLYENVYCQRGQMENLIKLHKAQLGSDRMSCRSRDRNQVRLALHTAAFWLMPGVRAAILQTSPLATAEFATIREGVIKIGACVIEHIARTRIQLPASCPERALFRAVELGLMPSGPISRGAVRPDEPPTEADQPRRVAQRVVSRRSKIGVPTLARSTDGQKCAPSCMIRARHLKAAATKRARYGHVRRCARAQHAQKKPPMLPLGLSGNSSSFECGTRPIGAAKTPPPTKVEGFST